MGDPDGNCSDAQCAAVLADPIAYIDQNCDLDAVLRIGDKSVADALRLLCPNLPGRK